MASEKAKYVVEMMRKAKAMPRQTGEIDYAKRRAFTEQRHAQQKTADGVCFEALELGGVETECCTPAKLSGEDVILYIHGGGFLTGSARASRGYGSFLAAESGLRVYTVSYRLAPDHPYPAAPDDCFAVYRALLDRRPGRKIALVGGSAGGNLCLVTALRSKAAGLPLPAALALYSPVGDQTDSLPSRRRNDPADCSIHGDIDQETRATYILDADPRDPDISPVYADLTGLPPMLLTVDADEVLFDDAALLAAHAQAAGVEAELQIRHGLFHDYPSVGPELPEAAQVMADTVALLRRCGM